LDIEMLLFLLDKPALQSLENQTISLKMSIEFQKLKTFTNRIQNHTKRYLAYAWPAKFHQHFCV